MEMRLSEPVERTIMYNGISKNQADIILNLLFLFHSLDMRNSFDAMLFYGNEASLVLFEALLFCLVDIYCHNYLTAGITTYILSKVYYFNGYSTEFSSLLSSLRHLKWCATA